MRCAIIDLDSVMFTAAHPNKVLDEFNQPIREDNKFVYIDKTEDEMFTSADQIISSVLEKCQADSYIAFIKGRGNFRYDTNTEYKANRPKESPVWWKVLKQHFIDKWGAIEINGIEVDDAVNITRLQIQDSFIVAIDKDLLSLEGTHYNWKTDKWFTIDWNEAYTKFWSDMIIGQSGDNVKGIPGKGPKYVEGLLSRESTTDRTFRDIVFNEYIQHFGEYKGIKEFYKNYISLYILESYEGFVIPKINKLSNNVEEEF